VDVVVMMTRMCAQEDEHLLATCPDLTSSKRWAIRYRKEEKRLLREYIRAYRRYVGMDA
jgi:hypothetical protein